MCDALLCKKYANWKQSKWKKWGYKYTFNIFYFRLTKFNYNEEPLIPK